MMLSDDELLAAFESTSLPFSEWTHEAHLRIAFQYVRRGGLAAAVAILRERIQAYNAAHGVPTTPTRGYHETITRAWAAVMFAVVEDSRFEGDSISFLRSRRDLLATDYLLRYYSRERLFSMEARCDYVEPDLSPLPRDPSNC